MDTEKDSNENNIVDKQSEVLSIIAHQIRSPLATILLTHQTLLDEKDSCLNEYQVKLLQQANKRADRIHKLTEELFKVERGLYSGADLDLAQSRIEDFVDSLLVELDVAIETKDLRVIRCYDQNSPSFSFDHSLLTDVLTNLLDNAISYTPKSGLVTITTRYENDEITVKVADSGSGILDTEVSKLFKKYSRLEGGVNNRNDGLGLGLHVAKIAVEKHGGKIWYEPNEPCGSSFVFTLPTTV